MNKKETKHQGRNIRHFRELKGIKQSALAEKLSTSQQHISQIEQSEKIEDKLLEQISEALEISPEAIKNFDPEEAVNLINSIHNNTFTDSYNSFYAVNYNVNPLEKIEELYERLLASEKEKVALLEKLLGEKGEK